MKSGDTQTKTAGNALVVLLVLVLIGVAIYGYFARKHREEERTTRQLPPPSTDQAEKIIQEKRR